MGRAVRSAAAAFGKVYPNRCSAGVGGGREALLLGFRRARPAHSTGIRMASTLQGIAARSDQTLALNMKLLSHHELHGFGGIGEGMGMQLARDGRRILWLAHESAPKNFPPVDVTHPQNPQIVVRSAPPPPTGRGNPPKRGTGH